MYPNRNVRHSPQAGRRIKLPKVATLDADEVVGHRLQNLRMTTAGWVDDQKRWQPEQVKEDQQQQNRLSASPRPVPTVSIPPMTSRIPLPAQPEPLKVTNRRPAPASSWRPRVYWDRGWQQPRFPDGHRHEDKIARDQLQPQAMGGKSKKDQLGSVAESWGEPGEVWQKIYGMFEIEEDPPSRSTSPYREELPSRSEVRDAKMEALQRARAGLSNERSDDNNGRWLAKSDEAGPSLVLPPKASPSFDARVSAPIRRENDARFRAPQAYY